jgi:transposase-like protein
MKRALYRWWLVVMVVVSVGCHPATGRAWTLWAEWVHLPRRARMSFNVRRHAERQAKGQARWARRQRRELRATRRRLRRCLQREVMKLVGNGHPAVAEPRRPVRLSPEAVQPPVVPLSDGGAGQPPAAPTVEAPPTPLPPDPLADLRAARGWIDHMDERQLWAILVRLRWPNGAQCPHCGEKDPHYLKPIDPDYRGGLGRWQCRVCALAGDPGQAGTFTPLTGTLLDGLRLDIRSLWMVVEALANGQASVRTAREAQVNRHSTDRVFRLLRAALYASRSTDLLVLNPDDVAECDEVYITAGLKGHAGGLALERAPRERGLKRRGRGTWESDRLPVFGLLCRGGQVRLFVLCNVQTETIRPIVHQMVARGAMVYTDSYAIYHFLERDGYRHQSVNHGAGEYALDLDGDGQCEVHCNTMECTWSWLRPMVRTYRGISKVYLPLYVAHFEFLFNHRHDNHWNRTLDVLQVMFQVDPAKVTDWSDRVDGAAFAEVCPVAG